MLVACGGASKWGAASVPININPPPSPNVGVPVDGQLETSVELSRASQGVPAVAILVVANDQFVEMAAVGERYISAVDAVFRHVALKKLLSYTSGMGAVISVPVDYE